MTVDVPLHRVAGEAFVRVAGVLTMNHLVRSTAGETVVGSIMVSDPEQALGEHAGQVRATAIARAGVRLSTAG